MPRSINTDIETSPPETGRRNWSFATVESGNCASETQPSGGKFRECRAYFCHANLAHRDLTGWLGRQDSNLGMAESKSTWFALFINTHSEKSRRFGFNGYKRLADISECRAIKLPPYTSSTVLGPSVSRLCRSSSTGSIRLSSSSTGAKPLFRPRACTRRLRRSKR